MSEFQYLEFRAIERPLSKEEQRALRLFSTRAEIGPRSFANEYHWGDFKGNAIGWMKKYFDAHVYLSNFGSRALHLRIPLAALDRESVRPYEVKNVLVVRQTGTHFVISIFSNEEPGRDYDYYDAEPSRVIDELLPLRDELARGDLRALYIVWLLGLRNGQVEEDTLELPVPDGLGELSAALESLVGFLWLEPELVEVAAKNSAPARPLAASKISPESWLASLTATDKEAWLSRLLLDEEGHALYRFQHEFRQAILADLRQSRDQTAGATPPRRRAGELLVAAHELADRKREDAIRKADEERSKREKKAAKERLAYLRSLIGQEDDLWKSAFALASTYAPSDYDTAVQRIGDLRDLAKLTGQEIAFTHQLCEFFTAYRKRPSLIERLSKAGLKI